MGWTQLSTSLRHWDSKPSGEQAITEVQAAAEDILSGGDEVEALKLFSEALDPSLEQGSDFLQRLAKSKGAKCRCDSVWYGDTIAYGCKTCGLSSASCICVFCFDAGEHEGHDFYISRSDYGCCDCGDAYAWKQSGFCRHHPGPRDEIDPSKLLPEETQRRAKLLIPAQVRRLVRFHPSVLPGVPPPPTSTSSEVESAEDAQADNGMADGPVSEADPDVFQSCLDLEALGSAEASMPCKVLVTGINLRVTEEQLKDFLVGKVAAAAPDEAESLALELVYGESK
ncbi:unnamed protein product, partial [Polarella glacialis]